MVFLTFSYSNFSSRQKTTEKYFFLESSEMYAKQMWSKFIAYVSNNSKKKNCRIFFLEFFLAIFFNFLRISGNVCRSEFKQNQSKTTFFVENCCWTISKSQKLKIKILFNEKCNKNRKTVFAYVSEHCASFGTKKIGLFWGPHFGEFSKILSKKSTIIQKLKMTKLFFHRFQPVAQLFGTKAQFGHFWGRGWSIWC